MNTFWMATLESYIPVYAAKYRSLGYGKFWGEVADRHDELYSNQNLVFT
jgi:hypothetical protein